MNKLLLLLQKCIYKYNYKVKRVCYDAADIYVEYYCLGSKIYWTKHIDEIEYKRFSSKEAFILGTLFAIHKQNKLKKHD